MTPEDQKFKAWLESQPDYGIFTTGQCRCPLGRYAKEVHRIKNPQVGLSTFREAGSDKWFEVATARVPVLLLIDTWFGFMTARRFKALYAESNKA